MTQRPYVLLSAAMSADGYLDDASGTRLVLSDEADLDRVDELRAGSDAILVGAQTIRSDNPRLQVRSPARRARRREAGLAASPRRVTITRRGGLDPVARFFTGDRAGGPRPLVYAAAEVAGPAAARLAAVATVVPAASAGGVDLAWVLADLAGRGVERLMVEGGAAILAQFLAAGLADEFLLAVAPLFVADPAAPRLLAGAGAASPGPAVARPAGRMTLAGVSRTGDMAVLRYLPREAAGL